MWFLQPGITFEYLVIRILDVLVITFFILPFHEFAHAFVAYKLGDKTAKSMGRMTLNPLVHFDPLGAICMMLFDFGWARPVPVYGQYFKNPRRDMAMVSLAGPVANLLAALVGGLVMNVLGKFGISGIFVNIFFTNYILINISLAVFNLIPIHPLDGSQILEALIPIRFLDSYYKHRKIIAIAIFLLLFWGFFSKPMTFLENIIYNFILKVTSLPF